MGSLPKSESGHMSVTPELLGGDGDAHACLMMNRMWELRFPLLGGGVWGD